MKKRFVFFPTVVWFLLVFTGSAFAQEQQDLDYLKYKASLYDTMTKDWAMLKRFQEANAKLAPPAKNENRVVFMGDSITDLWDNEGFGGFFPGKPYVNRGIGGQTTPQMLLRFRQDVVALKAKVVVILAGTNDIAGNTGPSTSEMIQDNFTSMTEIARANGIRVVLASLLPVCDYKKNKEGKPLLQTARRPPEKIRALNEWLKQFCIKNDVVYLDYYSAMVDDKGFLKEDLTYDGLHADARGYAVMAPLAEKAIAEALKKKR
ncbi:MAG: SGNH/GDSL hydrolase family protein [Acidobacteriota bacterium]